MKRYGHVPGHPGVTLFSAVCDMGNLKLAHEHASHGKQWYPEVKMVNEDPDYYLKIIQNMIMNLTYKTSDYEVFNKKENDKIRKIYKLPYYPDRIVQWAILQVIAPILEKHFTTDTYSSIPGRGPLMCAHNVCTAMHNDVDGTMYCLKIDIRHFYPSINHDKLKEKYKRLFKDPDLLKLIFEIIDSVPEDEGVPIGNYISQYSGNLYLSAFDHWIKEVMGVKYYFRYMDDMVFFSDSKEFLRNLLDEINKYLANEFLELKGNWQIFETIDRGIDYCGYILYHDHVLVRNRIRDRYIDVVERCLRHGMSEHRRASYCSYRGWIEHANTHNLFAKYGDILEAKYVYLKK